MSAVMNVGRTGERRRPHQNRVEKGRRRRNGLRDPRRSLLLLTILAQQVSPASVTLRQLAAMSGLPLVVCSRYVYSLARLGLISIKKGKGRKGCRIWLSHRGWLFLERLKCSFNEPENVPLSPTPPIRYTAVSLQTLKNTVGVALATLPAQVKSKTRLLLQEFKRLGGILRGKDDYGKAGRLFKKLYETFGFETAIEIIRCVLGAFGRCLATLVYALKYWALARLREWRGEKTQKEEETVLAPYHRKWSEVKKELYAYDDDEIVITVKPQENQEQIEPADEDEPDACIKCGRSISEVPLDEDGVCIYCLGYTPACVDCGTTESKPYAEIQFREKFGEVLCRPCFIKRYKKLLEGGDGNDGWTN